MPDDHDRLYQRGVALIDPYMQLSDRGVARSPDRDRHLRDGIACLDRALSISPSNWPALWMRGKAFQALGEHGAAAESFARAFRIEPSNVDVGREYMIELLETSQPAAAVEVARRISDAHPDDAGLLANLALAQVLAGDLAGASRSIDRALALDARDPVTVALKHRIDEIIAGKRARPRSLRELEGPP